MVSCLMGDSTALASAIVRCCPNNLQKGAKIMADLQLKITMGDIDVNIQGEGELVYKIFNAS